MDWITVVGFSANILSIVFYISPTMLIIDLCRTKDTSKIPYWMFIFTILNCLFWFIYGVQKGFWAVYLNNGLGLVMNLIYLCIFISHCQNLSLSTRWLLNILAFGFSAGFIASFIIFVTNVEVAGTVAMVFNICMFFSSLQKIADVFKYRDNTYIPFIPIVCLMMASTIWLLYGILQGMNMYLIIPNSIGLTISLFQVILWYVFNYPESMREKQANTQEDPDRESLVKAEEKKLENN